MPLKHYSKLKRLITNNEGNNMRKYYIERYRDNFGGEEFSVLKKGSYYHYCTYKTYDEALNYLNELQEG